MTNEFNSLLSAKMQAKHYSNKYNTFWYVVKSEQGYFVMAHSDGTANTVVTYYSGECWEDFSFLNTNLANAYFALNCLINDLLTSNYKTAFKRQHGVSLQNASKNILHTNLNTAINELRSVYVNLNAKTKFSNNVYSLVQSLESLQNAN